jgi:hypothetical protein
VHGVHLHGAVIFHTETRCGTGTQTISRNVECPLGDSFAVAHAVSLALVREIPSKIDYCATRRGRSAPASDVSAGPCPCALLSRVASGASARPAFQRDGCLQTGAGLRAGCGELAALGRRSSPQTH